MKELLFLFAGIVIGALLLLLIFELSSYPGEKEHHARQKVLDDSLATLTTKISTLERDIAISDGIINSNKDKISTLRDSLRNQIKLSDFDIPADPFERQAFLDSIISEQRRKLGIK